ncbi:MAG: exodeoxyribonuclease V subunit gamma, partial [Clostridia bacterium]|nr:exodeoxyribonuclease V subunit gamma [Clostridia bacterium]
AVPPQALQAVGSARLQDIALLYQGYQEAMAGLYTDTEDQMNWMIERIPDAPMIRGAAVFIDGFEMLTTQIYRAVRALIQTADSVTITFRLGLETDPDAPIFETEERHLARVLNIAREEGAAIETVFLPNVQFQPRHDQAALRHLERSLYDMSAPAYPHPPQGLRIIGCASPVQEAEVCARLVWESVRDQGLRFHEIAVLTADISAYGALLQQAFRRYGIPCFLDTKRTVGTHPLSRYLLQSLRAISLGFRAEEVLALSKTAFCALDMDEADELDELVKACGVRYLAPGTRIYSQAKRELLNPLREKLLSGQYRLRKALSGAQSAQAQAKALAEFLEYDGLIDRINAESARLQSCGEYEADAELRQVYQAISSMLTQIHNVLGGAPLSLRMFYDQLSAGLFAQEIGVLPATVDAVQVGTVARSLPGRTHTLILLGVNEGVLPAAILEDGLLTKQDQKKLTDSGVFMGNTPEQRAAEVELELYTVLSTPKQNLVLTYAKSSATGKVMQPSSLIGQIRALFPLLEEEQVGQAPEDLLQTEQSSILPLAAALRTARETGAPLPAPYHQALNLLSGHLAEPVRRYWAQQSAPEDNIGPALAASLYTLKDTMGVTALETYAACPFRYFAEMALLEPHGLQPFGHTGLDRGTYCHEVMDQYLTYLRRAQWAPETVTREQCEALVDRLCDEYEASVYLAEDYGHDGRSLHDAGATRRRMRESCWQATRHLVNGTFSPVRMEQQFDWRFDLKDGTPQTVRGRIDRVDKADTEDGTLVRVLDYKTGRDKFAYGDLYAGTALQLPLYAGQAAKRLNG